MLEETLSRTEQIAELCRETLARLEELYDCVYQEGNDQATLSYLADQLHILIQMEPQPRYALDGYDPRFIAIWVVVQQAFLKLEFKRTRLQKAYDAAVEEMERWKECITEVPYDEYLRLQEEEFAEGRLRNRDVQAGDTVVLLKSIWLYGQIEDKSPDVPFGTTVEVVHRGPAEGDTRDPQDYVTIKLGDLPHFSIPWTIVMPLALYNEIQASPPVSRESHNPVQKEIEQ